MSHVYVLSVHFRSPWWLLAQRRFLDAHLDVPHTRIFATTGIDQGLLRSDEISCSYGGDHASGLNQLAATACETAKDDDYLLFVDSDAFPVAPVSQLVAANQDLIAVRRDEFGDCQPHPCFALMKAGLWRELGGDWSRGYQWPNSLPDHPGFTTDVGGNLYGQLLEHDVAWAALTRTGFSHPRTVWFAVYGRGEQPVAYHHGAGSRDRTNKVDMLRIGWKESAKARAARLQEAWDLDRQVRAAMVDDLDFWRDLPAIGSQDQHSAPPIAQGANGGDRLNVLAVITPELTSAQVGIYPALRALSTEFKTSYPDPERVTPDLVADSDCVLFCRNHDPKSLRVLDLALLLGKPVIYHMDDNLLAHPVAQEPGRLRTATALRVLRRQSFMLGATRIAVTTPNLVDSVRALGRPADTTALLFDPAAVDEYHLRRPKPDREIVVFPSPRPNVGDTNELIEAMLAALLASRPNLELHLWRKYGELAQHPRVITHPIESHQPTFIRNLAALGAAVGLAPLGRSLFEDSKSNLKYRDLGGCGIPGVYSDTPVYSSVVEQGRTGLLVPNDPGQWVQAVGLLLDDQHLWHRIRDAAAADVASRFSVAAAARDWMDRIHGAVSEGPPARRPPRLAPGSIAAKVVPHPGGEDRGHRRVAEDAIAVCAAGVAAPSVRLHEVTDARDIRLGLSRPGTVLDARRARPGIQAEALRRVGPGQRVVVCARAGRSEAIDEFRSIRGQFHPRVELANGGVGYLADTEDDLVLISHHELVALGMALREQQAENSGQEVL